MSSQYPICIVSVQFVPHIYSPCPVSNISLKPIFSQYSNTLRPCHAFTHLYSPCSESTPFLQHKHRPNLISTAPLLSMSDQYMISTSDIQSVHHLICPYTIITPSLSSLLPMFSKTITSTITSQNSTSSARVQSEYTSAAHVQSVHHISCPHSI